MSAGVSDQVYATFIYFPRNITQFNYRFNLKWIQKRLTIIIFSYFHVPVTLQRMKGQGNQGKFFLFNSLILFNISSFCNKILL